ncbi:hypothetical protein BD769DRAFT_1375591, partial [Suillus cothurnatus]
DQDRDACFKKHGVRWTGLARLTYFDLVRCMIIDPMHNLFLGIVKTLWYNKWIQTSALRKSTDKRARELDIIHKFLATFEVPLWARQLPSRVGEPVGGSLTADEYKLAVTYTWPIVVSTFARYLQQLRLSGIRTSWRQQPTMKTPRSDFLSPGGIRKEARRVENSEQASTRPAQTFKKRKVDTELKPPKEPRPRLHADEPVNLLRLSTALEIFCGSSLDGAKAMKPNFHWAVHLEEQIRDFGPVYNFWTFLSERLNKLLKSSNSNNWTTGGPLEISMMRKFIRGIWMDALVSMPSLT